MSKRVNLQDWNLIDYKKAWEEQTDLHKELIEIKRADRKVDFQGHLILCEHPAVYTLGKSGSEDHLLVNAEQREAQGLQYYKINRGGDITHHGPGQLVGYPILDLEYWYRDVHRYVRSIEQVIIDTLAHYEITGMRMDGFTGVWTDRGDAGFQKLCAIGVHLSRWVSMHGFALNVNNDLNLFKNIVPCGITNENMSVTSMEAVSGTKIDIEDVKKKIASTFAQQFECELI